MKVLVAPRAGFCFGVKRAVELVEKTLVDATGRVSTLGPLVHNPQVVEGLNARGVEAVAGPAAGMGTLIVPSHGAPASVIAAARHLGVTVVDATCPCVRRAQRLAARLAATGYQVVVVGNESHPEIKAVVAAAGGALVVVDADGLDADRLQSRVGVICQTTLAPGVLAKVAAALAPVCREIVIHNTICAATYEHQHAALDLAGKVDGMVVVGGRESANTARLTEVCRAVVPTRQVEGARELDAEWFTGMERIGLTAGASTPAEQIAEVQRRLEAM